MSRYLVSDNQDSLGFQNVYIIFVIRKADWFLSYNTKIDSRTKFQYDPEFKGPCRNRSCTDVLCLLLFVLFMIAWIVVGILALQYGNPAKLLAPVDSQGLRCGANDRVSDKPFLFFFDITRCLLNPTLSLLKGCPTSQVCIKKCPNETFIYNPLQNYDSKYVGDKFICKYGVTENIKTSEEAHNAILKGLCAPWFLPSVNVAERCLPKANGDFKALTSLNITEETIDAAIHVVKILLKAKNIYTMIADDLSRSWPWISFGLCVAVGVCFLYIVLIRFFAAVMIWTSLFGVVLMLAYSCYASYMKYIETENSNRVSLENPKLKENFDQLLAKNNFWLYLCCLLAVILVLMFLIIIFICKRLMLAIALIKESSLAVASIPSTLVFPLTVIIIQAILIAWSFIVGLYLVSSDKNIKDSLNLTAPCSNIMGEHECLSLHLENFNATGNWYSPGNIEIQPTIVYCHIINIFGCFWSLCFASGWGDMILATTFSTWYWTFQKTTLPFFVLLKSIYITLRYHLGTVAFGSFILATCKMIKLLLEYINRKLKKYDNFVVTLIMCICRCFFFCLEKFIKFVNHNAYIMCAIHGKNFCISAKEAFELLFRNIVRVCVLNNVVGFLLFSGKLLITVGMMMLALYFFKEGAQESQSIFNFKEVPKLNYAIIPVAVIGVGTYIIASIFFCVYNIAVDTIFLCCLEDFERNDGSSEKPYFMPKNLMTILGKKNKNE